MKKKVYALLLIAVVALWMTGCSSQSENVQEEENTAEEQTGIDYMVLVNKENLLPEGWEDALETESLTNAVDDEVVVEKKAYEAYLQLKEALEKEGIYVDLDSAYRSVAEQQKIVDDFTRDKGEEYAKKYAAVPGTSEHHTGLALDLFFIVDDKIMYENDDLMKYPEIWAKIHEKLPEYGFILRYLPGKKDITGYAYEPWHIRYIGDADAAKEITDKGITLEEYLGRIPSHAASVDYGTSELYSQEEMDKAITEFKKEFENWDGCTLNSISYAGDECNSEDNIKWANDIKEGKNYTQCIEFLTSFHSPTEEEQLKDTAWEPDHEYTDYQWWLARTDGGDWELVSWGY